MTVSFTDLRELGFVASHKIKLDADGMPRFVTLADAPLASAPAVYLWLAHADGAEAVEVLYVGKAGKGVARRSSQHQNGFVTSGTGRKNAAALNKILKDQGMFVTVMVRSSDIVSLFGKTVSMYATEEDALCALFGPRLNRAMFPEVSIHKAATSDVVSKHVGETAQPFQADAAHAPGTEGDLSRIATLINSRLRVQDEGTVDDMLAQVDAYMPQELARLRRALAFLETRLLSPDDALKLIGGYTDQPKGCNGVTTLGFGRLVGRNFARRGWVARIYLTATPRLSLSLSMINSAAHGRVETNDKLFAPIDLDAFLGDPAAFVNSDYLR